MEQFAHSYICHAYPQPFLTSFPLHLAFHGSYDSDAGLDKCVTSALRPELSPLALIINIYHLRITL